MKVKVKAIIFDYGNTLIFDPFERILKLKIKKFQKKLRKFGYKPTQKIFECWYEANKNVNYQHITHFAQEEPIIEEALKRLGISSNLS